VKSVYFFAGNARKSWKGYDGEPYITANMDKYTIKPFDDLHLGWSEARVNRRLAIDEIVRANVNTITMSSCGSRSDDRWAFWAPMYTSPRAQEQLFDETVNRDLLIIPTIESARGTIDLWMGWSPKDPTATRHPRAWPAKSWSFNFASEFPRFAGDPSQGRSDPAPLLVTQIVDLLERFVIRPQNAPWKNHWAKLYDRRGRPRYAINLLHVASNQLRETEDAAFAEAFDLVAEKVRQPTGLEVGFTLDPMPLKREGGRGRQPEPGLRRARGPPRGSARHLEGHLPSRSQARGRGARQA
jgi:hypothetical protein